MGLTRIPSWLGYVLKFGAAAAVIVVMWRSGKLRPEVITAAAQRWPILLLVAAMMYAILAITALRWRLLLQGQGFHLPFGQAVSLTMIGTMFSSVIPGAVSGDVVKGYYLAREVDGRRAVAVASILMDRILGLASLATVASIGVIWNYDLVLKSRTLAALSLCAVGGCIVGCAGLGAALATGKRILELAERLPERFPARGLMLRLCDVLVAYRGHAPSLLAAYGLSFPVHLLGCGMMALCLKSIDASRAIPMSLVLFAFPLGVLAISVPITPAGIGVGQAAFYAVCNMAVQGSGAAGANAFTVFQAVVIPIYLTGLFPYLAYRKDLPKTNDTAV